MSKAALLLRALREPGAAIHVSMAILRGRWYRYWCRLSGTRFRAGSGFRLYGRLKVSGPGEVIFGDRVSITGRVTPFTYSPDARITVGNDCVLDSVRFGCQREITIGSWCIFAECRIMDTDFHSTRVDRRTNGDAPIRVEPVRIGDNAWVGLNAGILPGTSIGENSVVSYGAVCARDYPANSIIMGNPARVVGQIAGAEPV